MKTINIGDTMLWEGKPAKVIYSCSFPTIGIEIKENTKCPHCKAELEKEQFSVVPTSKLFQESATNIRSEEESKELLNIAAPDLFNALQVYLNAGSKEQRREASVIAKKAINKALG